jgi:small subunit ribosomal protein S1
MEHNNALIGQEVEPEKSQVEAQANDQETKERPAPEMPSMESLLEEQGLSLDFPRPGEIRQGIIATIRENEILVSVGTKSEGILTGRELEQIPSEEREAFHVGQEIPVYVVAPEDQNGNVVLSYIRAREEKDWEVVESMLASGEAHASKIIGYNKGGLIVPIGGLRGFVPASQISLVRRTASGGDSPEQRWGKMVGEEIKVRVIEVDRERRRLILSERLALQETRETLKERLLEELSEGDIRTGRVTSLADFGAFVNIEGADGLVHLSEISWDRIQHPSEVLKVGQEVKVKVISVDQERKRIGLSIRQLQKDPWLERVEKLKEGMLIEGTITHLTKFGAFARLDEELEGLIHVSELSDQRVGHPKEVVHEGDVLTLRVIKLEPERRRIGLSLRKVDSPAYADFDWKMALAEEVDKATEREPATATGEGEAVEETPHEEAKAVVEQRGEAETKVEAEEAKAVVEQQSEPETKVEAEEAKAVAEQQNEPETKVEAEEAKADVEQQVEPEMGAGDVKAEVEQQAEPEETSDAGQDREEEPADEG